MNSLKTWFTIHAVVDLLFGIPLFLIPTQVLTFMGWSVIDPFASRLVGASLIGIAVLSIACNKADNKIAFKTALQFKSAWSILGFLASLYGAVTLQLSSAYAIALLFFIFGVAWNWYRVHL
jgi:hypothetical protein